MLKKAGIIRLLLPINVNRSTIIYWRNHKNEYNNVDNPKKRITLHKGKNPLFPKKNYMNFLNLIENWENVLQQDLWFISF